MLFILHQASISCSLDNAQKFSILQDDEIYGRKMDPGASSTRDKDGFKPTTSGRGVYTSGSEGSLRSSASCQNWGKMLKHV